jgi:hypothetical protein
MPILPGVKIQQWNTSHVLRIKKSCTVTSFNFAKTFIINSCWPISDLKLFLCKTYKNTSWLQITKFGVTNICDLTSDGSIFEIIRLGCWWQYLLMTWWFSKSILLLVVKNTWQPGDSIISSNKLKKKQF